MKRLLGFLLAATLLLATACGNNGGAEESAEAPSQAPTPAEETSEEESPAGTEATLSFMHFQTEAEALNGNFATEAFRHTLEEWQQANPGVTLDITEMDNDSWRTKMATLASVGDLPDVYILMGMNTREWEKSNLMLDLTDVLEECEWGGSYNQDYLAAFTGVNGELYALPIMAVNSTTVLAYDSRLWEEAGFDSFPATWDEVLEADQYFSSLGIDTIAFGNADQWQAHSTFLSAIGNRFTGSDWFWSIINREGASYEDAEFVDALAFTQDIFTSGVFNVDFNAVNHETAREYFLEGQAASMIGGSWDIDYLESELEDEMRPHVKIATLPQPAGATAATATQASGLAFGLAINPALEGERLEAAKSLVTYLSGPAYAEYLGSTYAQKASCDVDIDLSIFSDLVVQMYEYGNNPACEIYDSYMDAGVMNVMGIALQELMNGDKTPEQVAAECQAAYEG